MMQFKKILKEGADGVWELLELALLSERLFSETASSVFPDCLILVVLQ